MMVPKRSIILNLNRSIHLKKTIYETIKTTLGKLVGIYGTAGYTTQVGIIRIWRVIIFIQLPLSACVMMTSMIIIVQTKSHRDYVYNTV